jgi:hypothetical protein
MRMRKKVLTLSLPCRSGGLSSMRSESHGGCWRLNFSSVQKTQGHSWCPWRARRQGCTLWAPESRARARSPISVLSYFRQTIGRAVWRIVRISFRLSDLANGYKNVAILNFVAYKPLQSLFEFVYNGATRTPALRRLMSLRKH